MLTAIKLMHVNALKPLETAQDRFMKSAINSRFFLQYEFII